MYDKDLPGWQSTATDIGGTVRQGMWKGVGVDLSRYCHGALRGNPGETVADDLSRCAGSSPSAC